MGAGKAVLDQEETPYAKKAGDLAFASHLVQSSTYKPGT